MFGGYGYLSDYGVEKIVRDLRVHQISRARTRSCASLSRARSLAAEFSERRTSERGKQGVSKGGY